MALIAAFGGVIAALATAGVALNLALHGPVRELESIANDHARAVQVTARIRSSMSLARRQVIGEATAPRNAGIQSRRPYGALQAMASELAPLCNTDLEARKLASLRAALARSGAGTEAIEARLASGDRDGALSSVGPFLESTAEANEAVDAILAFNAVQVERSARQVQRSLGMLALAMLGLALAGGVGAYTLLRFALRGLASQQSMWQVRFTDVDAFAARAAHELRTPLQTLTLALASGGASALDRARRSVEGMRRTIDALLEFSRAGAAPRGHVPADVLQGIAEVQEECASLIEQKRATVALDVPKGVAVVMEPEHFRTIVRNLVGNALRHGSTPAGVRISLRATVEDGRVRLEVGDDGPGIPPAALAHVFEPFARGTDAPGGYGVGLATVHRLVEGHGGTIAIETASGRGTTVRIELPAAALRTADSRERSTAL
jgi:signal transduction histidine kinase